MQRPAPPAFQIKSTTAVIATLAIATASLVAVRAQQAPGAGRAADGAGRGQLGCSLSRHLPR